jgi:hypothetical protein
MGDAALERLLDSLLYEGYALYPYTPGAIKNATPTPFGILYPPSYAAGGSTTFDHLELRCLAAGPADAELGAEVAFLSASGERHKGELHRLELPTRRLEELTAQPCEGDVRVSGLRVHMLLSARRAERPERGYEACLRVANRASCPSGLDRAQALERSLLSTHPILRLRGGRFRSPLEHLCASANTFPVLATPGDDVVLGATIVLPDHPEIAPESRGAMFDSTEIEEALLLHVHALSDGERAEIERQDPAVRAMVARAAAATPQDIMALHGRVTLTDPADERAPGPAGEGPADRARARSPFTAAPPREPPGLLDPREGEESREVDGSVFRRGGHVRIRPGADADLHARMLDGRTATIERILIDYDGRTHLGVTIDGDPGQALLRESSRLLFFFPGEVEVLAP